MKNHILLSLILCITSSFAQELKIDPVSKKYQYEGVVNVENASKNELFNKAKQWIAHYYKSSADAIKYANKEDDTIILKATYHELWVASNYWVDYTIALKFKDGRFKYLFSDFYYSYHLNGRTPLEDNFLTKNGVLKKLRKQVESSAKSLTEYISAPQLADNW